MELSQDQENQLSTYSGASWAVEHKPKRRWRTVIPLKYDESVIYTTSQSPKRASPIFTESEYIALSELAISWPRHLFEDLGA